MFLKKKFLLTFFYLFLCFPFFGAFYPSQLTEKSQVSILTLNYNDNSKNLFNRHILRFYDRDQFFDEVFDFSSFENFEDKLFTLKFLFKNKEARFKSQSFMEFYKKTASNKNLVLTENVINLSLQQKNQLYYKIIFQKIISPNYSYQFDFYKKNSATQIINLLKEVEFKTNDSLFYSNYYTFPSSLAFLSFFSSKNIKPDFSNLTNESFENPKILISSDTLSKPAIKFSYLGYIFQAIFFLILTGSLFQLLYKFKSIYYRSFVNLILQSFDFIILFISGIAGLIIVYFNLFTYQFLLTFNINFLFLNPLNLVLSFLIFSEKKHEVLRFIILLTISFMILSYLTLQIINRSFQPIALSCCLILFIRVFYYCYESVIKYIFQKLKCRNINK